MFNLNQIVKGKNAGTFLIIGFRVIDNCDYAQLKSVNPKDHSQLGKGEIALPLDSLIA